MMDAPWRGNLVMAGSEDGLNFGEEAPFLEHAGVSNLLRTSSGQLIATYQYFSFEDEALFDIMAYSTSNDDGKTWEGHPRLSVETFLPFRGNRNWSIPVWWNWPMELSASILRFTRKALKTPTPFRRLPIRSGAFSNTNNRHRLVHDGVGRGYDSALVRDSMRPAARGSSIIRKEWRRMVPVC